MADLGPVRQALNCLKRRFMPEMSINVATNPILSLLGHGRAELLESYPLLHNTTFATMAG